MMNMEQEKRYFLLVKQLDELFPKYLYENTVVATAIALEKFNSEWLRKSLLLAVEEKQLGYDEALALNKKYMSFAEKQIG